MVMGKRKRSPRTLRQFVFNDRRDLIDEHGLEFIKGQCEIVLSVLRNLPMPTDSREVSTAIGAHPHFKTKISEKGLKGCIKPEDRVANYFICWFKRIGLIQMLEQDIIE